MVLWRFRLKADVWQLGLGFVILGLWTLSERSLCFENGNGFNGWLSRAKRPRSLCKLWLYFWFWRWPLGWCASASAVTEAWFRDQVICSVAALDTYKRCMRVVLLHPVIVALILVVQDFVLDWVVLLIKLIDLVLQLALPVRIHSHLLLVGELLFLPLDVQFLLPFYLLAQLLPGEWFENYIFCFFLVLLLFIQTLNQVCLNSGLNLIHLFLMFFVNSSQLGTLRSVLHIHTNGILSSL